MLKRTLTLALLSIAPAAYGQRAFRVDETTIADVHAAMRAGSLTCRTLVEAYLRRIDAYDKQGPAINAITVLNTDALAIADSLDRRFRETRQLSGPLHCVPDDRQRQLPNRSDCRRPQETSRSRATSRRPTHFR